jgi:hypothetical protein
MADTNKPVTHVLMVIDMSGSMDHLASDVRGGFNAYLDTLRRDSDEMGNVYRVTVTLFHNDIVSHAIDRPLDQVDRLDEDNYTPGLMTALYDAIGRTLGGFKAKHGDLAEGERAVLVIQTDGLENSSREFSKAAIRKSIEDREATGQWTCIYMGAGPTAWAVGDSLGMGKFSLGATQSRFGTQSVYSGLGTATAAYASGATGGETFDVLRSTPGVVDEDAEAQAKQKRSGQ